MQQISPLFNSLLKHNRAGLSTEDFLRQLTHTHPYFIPAQFFLLQQINEEHSTYNEQAAKTALFFNNPYWLNFQLQYTKPANIINEAIENADNDDDATTEMQIPQPEKLIITESTGSIAPPIISENLKLSPEELMLAENADNDDDEAIVEEEIAPIKINISTIISTAGNEDALTFEPLHLVDYFASQGIKLSDDNLPADKLGKQLKSFTDWLKTMKKIHVPATEMSQNITDVTIQNLAEKSNTEGEVVTESMAEVFARQGKLVKAIEVYKKLSLLNPSKIAYFAAKIEQLKGS